MVGNTNQTVNSPIYENMNTSGNAEKLGIAHSNIQTLKQNKVIRSWLGANLQCISQHTTESAHKPTRYASEAIDVNHVILVLTLAAVK